VGLVALLVGLGIGGAAAGGSTTDTTASADTPTATTTITEGQTAAPTTTVTKTPPAPTATETRTVKVTPTPKPAISANGIWLVGTDIKPGTYRATGHGGCYWARLSNLSGSGIIANGLGANQIVTISSSDKAFETQDCGDWTRVT
jgi:hypothetical protein